MTLARYTRRPWQMSVGEIVMPIKRLEIALGLSVTRLMRSAHSNGDGIDQYTLALFERVRVAKRVPVVLGQVDADSFQGLPLVKLPPVHLALLSGILLGQSIGAKSWRHRFDLLHTTDHWIPRLKGIPVIATVHDAVPISHPQWVRGRATRLKAFLWRISAGWAQHVITDSVFSKREIMRCFGLPENKISVVPLGVNLEYFEKLSPEVCQLVVGKFALPEQFFLFVGTIQPRKNLERIVAAHKSLPSALRKNYPLLIVGAMGWGCESLISDLSSPNADESLRWLGPVDDLTKRALLQLATALVFPSLLEGFGLPVLEAFASGTPVITSNASSLPEVAGDAAWMVDPMDVGAIADAMKSLVLDDALRSEFVARGLLRARGFTWDDCARKTEQIYADVLGKH